MIVGFDEGLVEVHEDEAIVDLNHTVLKATVDAQFFLLGFEADCRLILERNRHLVELHQRLEHRRADGRGARESDEARDVDLVGGREIALRERDVVLDAILEEALGDGLEEANAAIVAVETQVADHLLGRGERRVIDLARNEAKTGRFGQRQLHAEVREGERYRLAEIAVGRIAQESGTGEGIGLNRFHERVGVTSWSWREEGTSLLALSAFSRFLRPAVRHSSILHL